MSSTRNQLIQTALELGSGHKRRELDTQEKKNALRLEMQQQEHIAKEARFAFERSLNFDVTLGTDYLCPRCWVAQGVRSTLVAVPTERHDEDDFQCSSCGGEFTFLA
jgi:hypothetical protein